MVCILAKSFQINYLAHIERLCRVTDYMWFWHRIQPFTNCNQSKFSSNKHRRTTPVTKVRNQRDPKDIRGTNANPHIHMRDERIDNKLSPHYLLWLVGSGLIVWLTTLSIDKRRKQLLKCILPLSQTTRALNTPPRCEQVFATQSNLFKEVLGFAEYVHLCFAKLRKDAVYRISNSIVS